MQRPSKRDATLNVPLYPAANGSSLNAFSRTKGFRNKAYNLTKNALQLFCERPLISKFAFPNDKHLPAQCSERRSFLGVSGDVLSKLFLPEAYSGPWRTGVTAAIMSMPETAMDQDNTVIYR
jgi:hypothetical protein